MGLIAWLAGKPDAVAAPPGRREAAWEAAFRANSLPSFVATRLRGARTGAAPWTSTASPAELLLIRRHRMRPVAIVSGTCWFKCGNGSTDSAMVTGWRLAIARIQAEAREAGAHIVVDTRLRSATGDAASREYTLVGTALRAEGIDLGPVPLVTTMSGLATLQLLLSGIVPTGIAFGAAARSTAAVSSKGSVKRFLDGRGTFKNLPLPELTDLSSAARRAALASLVQGAKSYGNQLLAHDIAGDIERIERDKAPTVYVARYTVVATVIDASRARPSAAVGTGLVMNDIPLPSGPRGATRL